MKTTLQIATPLVAVMCATSALGKDLTYQMKGRGLNEVTHPFVDWQGQAMHRHAVTASHTLHKRSPIPVLNHPEGRRPPPLDLKSTKGNKSKNKDSKHKLKKEEIKKIDDVPATESGKKALRMAEAEVLAHGLYKRSKEGRIDQGIPYTYAPVQILTKRSPILAKELDPASDAAHHGSRESDTVEQLTDKFGRLQLSEEGTDHKSSERERTIGDVFKIKAEHKGRLERQI